MREKHVPGQPCISDKGPKKTQWHPAFCASMRLELLKDKEKLNYYMEYALNTKPLLVDFLVIKKEKGATLESKIGKLFRGHNIIEYKSPRGALNIDVFYKTLGCAQIYKSHGEWVNEILIQDIVVMFVRKGKPVKLIKLLKQSRIPVEQIEKGIYKVGYPFFGGVYILVTKELDEEEYIWLTSLNDRMTYKAARALIRESHKLRDKDDMEYADSVLQVAMERNKELFKNKKGDKDMCKAFWELFQPEIEEEKRRSEMIGEKNGELRGEKRGKYLT